MQYGGGPIGDLLVWSSMAAIREPAMRSSLATIPDAAKPLNQIAKGARIENA
jgi:hypothetical protein